MPNQPLAANVIRRIATGPQATFSMDRGRIQQEEKSQWPFPWVYPPPKSQRRTPNNYIVMPDVGVTAAVFSYSVESGFQFDMTEVMFCAVTVGMVPIASPGDVLYTINYNTPPTGTAPQQSPLADLNNIPFSWGSPTNGPVTLARAEEFAPLSVITLYATNVAASPGAPNFIVGMFGGWERKA